MSKFFIPYAKDERQMDSVYNSVVVFMQQQGFSINTHRKILKIHYRHNGMQYVDEVGKKDRYGTEEIILLLDAGRAYLCCTPNRGVMRGGPILIGKDFDTNVFEFDNEA